MKINNGPQAAVAIAAIVAVSAIVISLVLAGWSAEAIIGMAAAAVALATGQLVNARRTSVVEAKTDQQSETLDTIRHQTNGGMKAAIAAAVSQGIADGMALVDAHREAR